MDSKVGVDDYGESEEATEQESKSCAKNIERIKIARGETGTRLESGCGVSGTCCIAANEF